MANPTSDVTESIKRFGKPSTQNTDSTAIATINQTNLTVNGSQLDIVIGMFEREGVIASREVIETMSILLLESAKALNVEIDELLKISTDQRSILSFTEIGVNIVNRFRPITSKIGIKTVSVTPAKTVLVNRNILA